MSIKKALKKERTTKKKIVLFALSIMAVMTYVVMSLYAAGYFEGYEKYLAIIYIIVVDSLLFLSLVRVFADNKFEFQLQNDKVKIKDGIFSSGFTIPFDWFVFVDAAPKVNQEDIEILLVMQKGRRNKKFFKLSDELVRIRPAYKDTYRMLIDQYPKGDLFYYIVRKSGAKKYYYLYQLYKNIYDVKFSDRAVTYIRDFMEEYKL